MPSRDCWLLARDTRYPLGLRISNRRRVAAMDANSGVISPGGVGYDINCGVRLIRTNLQYGEIAGKVDRLADALFQAM